MDRLSARNAELLAVSTDSVYTLGVFRAALGGLPFRLGSDWMRRVSRDYGVLIEEQGIARRSVFVINGDGQVVFVNRQFSAGEAAHYEAVIDAIPS
jgi:peroxiredoxin (alkyl hydroperoxide reductase subunit C)